MARKEERIKVVACLGNWALRRKEQDWGKGDRSQGEEERWC